jgi:RNA polymerase sigma factor (sigma-70 family)
MAEQGPGPTAAGSPVPKPRALIAADASAGKVWEQSDLHGVIGARMAKMGAEFVKLYDEEYNRVIRFLMYVGASLHEAEDATQEAFAAAWNQVRDGRWNDIANPPGWIRSVGIRKYYRDRRAEMTEMTVPNLDEAPDPGERPTDLADDALLVLEALHGLPPRQRVTMAFEFDGFTCRETADYLGITDQQVRDLRKKARKVLAAKIDEHKARRRRQ